VREQPSAWIAQDLQPSLSDQHPFLAIDDHSVSMLRILSLLEARVLGVLVEKERTVPDSYPLTLNALVGGCNQKSSRSPGIRD